MIMMPRTLFSSSKEIWIGSFNVGSKHSFWSRGCKSIRGQNWRSKKNLPGQPGPGALVSNPAETAIFFSTTNFDLLCFCSLLTYKRESRVPHLKDLIHICLEPEVQDLDMTFHVCYVGSKYPYFASYRGSCQNKSEEHHCTVGIFVLLTGVVWDSNCLEGGVTNTSPISKAKFAKTGYPLFFLGVQTNKQKLELFNFIFIFNKP